MRLVGSGVPNITHLRGLSNGAVLTPHGQATNGRNPRVTLLCQGSEHSGVVQLVARQPLELVILVRVQAPEPFCALVAALDCCGSFYALL
jgi:hypothetical protein